MEPFAFESHIFLTSKDLALLRDILDCWICEKGVDLASEEAAHAGCQLIEWYQFGIRSPIQLRSLLEPM